MGGRPVDAAGDPPRAERGHLPRRERCRPHPRVPHQPRRIGTGGQHGVRHRPVAALRHRVLAARRSALRLCRQHGQRGPLRLSQRRPRAARRPRGGGGAPARGRPLDARPRRLGGRHAAIPVHRLGFERRHLHPPAPAAADRAVGGGTRPRRRVGLGGGARGGATTRSAFECTADLRHRPAQLRRPRDPAGRERGGRRLVRHQRARRARRRPAAGLRDACGARRVLRLAVVLHRQPRGPAPARPPARSRGPCHRARRADPAALRPARHHVLRRRHVPARVPRRRLRGAARLMEPRQADRLQGGAHSNAERPAHRRLSGLPHRLRRFPTAPSGRAPSMSRWRRTARCW